MFFLGERQQCTWLQQCILVHHSNSQRHTPIGGSLLVVVVVEDCEMTSHIVRMADLARPISIDSLFLEFLPHLNACGK